MQKLYFFLIAFIFTFLCGCNQKQPDILTNQSSNSQLDFSYNANFTNLDRKNLLPGIEKIVNRGTLKVAMINIDIDGFCETQSDGSLKGLDVQLAQNIARSLGVSLSINRESDTYDKLTDLLINDQVDLVISNYSLTTNRAAKIKFSKPYLTTRLGIMLNKQNLVKYQIEKNPIDFLKNNKIKIATFKGSSHSDFISSVFPNAEIVEMDNYKDMCHAVYKNEVFGFFSGEPRFLCNYNDDPELQLYTKVFVFSDALEKYCIGVSENNNDLLNFVNSYIDLSKELTLKDYENLLKEKSNKNVE